MELKTISASSYNLYNECPHCWMLQYKLKLIQPESEALKIGKMYHSGLEMFHNGISEQEVIDTIKKQVIKDPSDQNIKQFTVIRQMLEAYFRKPLLGKTVATEYNFFLPLQKCPAKLCGFIDKVVEGGIDEYKTSSIDYTEEDTKTIQSLIYSYAYKQRYGAVPVIRYSVNNKKKCSKKDYVPQLITIQRTQEELDTLEDLMLEMYQNVYNNKFDPIPGKKCKFCNYEEFCPHCKSLKWK